MTAPNIAVVDDTLAALRRLSPLGRNVIENAALTVRHAVSSVASSIGATIIDHDAYVDWLRATLPGDAKAVLLDPLIDSSSVPRAISIRLSRYLRDDEWKIAMGALPSIDELNGSTRLAIVDDVVVSGKTLVHACAELASRGHQVRSIVVCCSFGRGREHLEEMVPGAMFCQWVAGAHIAIHLRDACPYLPFSGRPTADQPDIETASGRIAVRQAGMFTSKGPWARFFADYRVVVAVARARSEVAGRFAGALGREPTVEDLLLLGPEVPVSSYRHHAISPRTSLASIA